MNLKKDLKKLKDILLGIDFALLIIALAVAVYCGVKISGISRTLNNGYQGKSEQLDLKIQELQTELTVRRPRLEAMMDQRQADRDAAQVQRDQVLADLTAVIEQRDIIKSELSQLQTGIAGIGDVKSKIADLRLQYGKACRELEDKILAGESKYRIVYLTFDDGPSYLTKAFLEDLERLDVYATFFTIGVGVQPYDYDQRDECLRLEAMGGHTIANHTYSHAFGNGLYNSVDTFMEAVREQDQLVYDVTGIHTDIVRFPAGSYYSPHRKASIEALAEEGFGWIDWLGNAYDSGNNNYSADYTANVVINQARTCKIYVVLMHDWVNNTRRSLDKIVTTLQKENYVFLPLFKESSTIGNVYPRWDN